MGARPRHGALADRLSTVDVLVYGATPAGIVASIAASREGATVSLVEPSSHLGGMLSGGLGRTDVDEQEPLIGGLARELFERIGRGYDATVAWQFEPHVVRDVLERWLQEARIDVAFGVALGAVSRAGPRLTRIASREARVFIDASYEGDLLAAAGNMFKV